MNRFVALLVNPFVMGLLGGCGALPGEAGDEGDEAVVQVADAFTTTNAVTPNAMTPPGLTASVLSADALSLDTMSPSNLAALQDPGAEGALSRTFLRYAVGCAFTPDQHFTFAWTDASGIVVQEDYKGELGLAPAWAEQALSEAGQRRVSACLAARTNLYGERVMISVRGLGLGQPDADELTSYPREEGAFWGNIFAPTPALYACYNKRNIDNSRANLRDCAAGHLEAEGTVTDCGSIEIVGPCNQYCAPTIDPGLGHIYCSADPSTLSSAAKSVYAISVYLP